MKYKALITDVDGTIINNITHATLPTQPVIDALREASKHLSVNLATGRPLREVRHLFEALGITGLAVINGGAQIIDIKSEKILKENLILHEDIEKIARLLKGLGIDSIVGNDDTDVLYTPNTHIQKPVDMLTQPLTLAQAERAASLLSSIPTINTYIINRYHDNKFDLHITHLNATKQVGVLMIAEQLGIKTSEMIGIGDGYNDFPLLMACGLKVAMGNAVDDLKQIADFIAPPVEKDGVVEVIRKYVLQQS